MRYDPDQHHRRSIRLRGQDYAAPGAYFVTICVHGRRCVFGDVWNGEMQLNDAGMMIRAEWEALPRRIAAVELDAYVVMPNHFHAIVTLVDTPARGARLGDVIGAFKSLTTNEYSRAVHDRGWPPFDRRLWQRNYFEHIIRDQSGMGRIRKYIAANPAHWRIDQLHPAAAPNRFNQE